MGNNDRKGREMELVFLSREDLEILIYMTSDVWITPELKRFKNGILNGLKAEDHDD
jgi:hypothetical protein